jgi:arginase family enzyme
MVQEWPQISDGVPTFLGVEPARSVADLRGADVAIIGVPYMTPMFGFDADLTPRKVREASTRYAGTYLPEFDLDVGAALRIVDYGDAPIDRDDLAGSVSAVQARVLDALAASALPITLGGSAPCSGYPCAAALSEFHAGRPIGAINLDAHGDNRESWQGDTGLQAGTWVRHQLKLPGFSSRHHMQIGMRGPGNPKPNADWFREQGCGLYTGLQAKTMGVRALSEEVIQRAGDGTIGLWFGVDWDVLDMSVSPEWVYPEPFGMDSADLLRLAYDVGRNRCLGASTMSGPAHATSMHWIAIWTILYLLAGVASARQDGSEESTHV